MHPKQKNLLNTMQMKKKEEGGLMDLKDGDGLRDEGGFVPIGKERADDVPARLSKNDL